MVATKILVAEAFQRAGGHHPGKGIGGEIDVSGLANSDYGGIRLAGNEKRPIDFQ
jgi:hypothetical protein